jgi:ABC-type sugar transport system ATPase subunit
MSAVEFRGVSKRFGAVEALSALDLAIETGEFVSLLGPSGSGKTTTLNLLAGLLDADDGEITIDGRVVNDVTPDKRDIAMVFQNYALYPHMTVFENIAFPLRARGRRVPEMEIEQRVERNGDLLGIGDLLARYPRELSGGQQQRVALGRAMVRDPKVFLLDEPLSNLDARLRIRMRYDLKALHQRIRSTIVYVTHDQAEAMSLSSRIAVFNKGRLQQYASPFDIYNRPANLFVANFVGEREILQFEVTGRLVDGRMRLESPAFKASAPALRGFGALDGRKVILGLRAEALRLADANEPDAIGATVTQTELAGPDQIVFAQAEGGAELCWRADPTMRIAAGDRVRIALRPDRIHVFDPATSAAIPIHS